MRTHAVPNDLRRLGPHTSRPRRPYTGYELPYGGGRLLTANSSIARESGCAVRQFGVLLRRSSTRHQALN
jgi:hypothetical protein